LLDDLGIVGPGDADAIGYAEDVAIDRQSWHAQRVPEHDVGGLSTDTRQLDEVVHRVGNMPRVPLDDGVRHPQE